MTFSKGFSLIAIYIMENRNVLLFPEDTIKRTIHYIPITCTCSFECKKSVLKILSYSENGYRLRYVLHQVYTQYRKYLNE